MFHYKWMSSIVFISSENIPSMTLLFYFYPPLLFRSHYLSGYHLNMQTIQTELLNIFCTLNHRHWYLLSCLFHSRSVKPKRKLWRRTNTRSLTLFEHQEWGSTLWLSFICGEYKHMFFSVRVRLNTRLLLRVHAYHPHPHLCMSAFSLVWGGPFKLSTGAEESVWNMDLGKQ